MKIMASEIRNLFNLSLFGDDTEIDGLNLVDRKSSNKSILSYVTKDIYIEQINKNNYIKCLLVSPNIFEFYTKNINRRMTFLLTADPELIFYQTFEYLVNFGYINTELFEKKIGNNPVISATAIVEDSVTIGDNCVIGDFSVISKNTIIGDNVTIGRGVKVGSQGFQIIKFRNVPHAIQHVGGVKIGDNVFIGDNTVISRNLFEGYNTIGDNVKIDSLCSISHNCEIGNNSILASGVKMCGSSIIQEDCWIGTNSTILNKVTIESNSLVGIGSVVVKNIPNHKVVYGTAATIKRDNFD